MRKASLQIYIISLLAILLMSSCAFEMSKRRYSNGWSVRFSTSKQTPEIKKMPKAWKPVALSSLQPYESFQDSSTPKTSPIIQVIPKDTIKRVIGRMSVVDTIQPKRDSDTLVSDQIDYVPGYENVKKNLEKGSIATVIVFVLALTAVILAGTLVSVGVTTAVLHPFYLTMLILTGVSIWRFIKMGKVMSFLYREGPRYYDTENPIHDAKLKRRFRMMVNALFIMPLASLFMAIILHKRLKSNSDELDSELNYLLRNKAGWYIFYSVLVLLLWTYLFYLSYPYLFITLFKFI